MQTERSLKAGVGVVSRVVPVLYSSHILVLKSDRVACLGVAQLWIRERAWKQQPLLYYSIIIIIVIIIIIIITVIIRPDSRLTFPES